MADEGYSSSSDGSASGSGWEGDDEPCKEFFGDEVLASGELALKDAQGKGFDLPGIVYSSGVGNIYNWIRAVNISRKAIQCGSCPKCLQTCESVQACTDTAPLVDSIKKGEDSSLIPAIEGDGLLMAWEQALKLATGDEDADDALQDELANEQALASESTLNVDLTQQEILERENEKLQAQVKHLQQAVSALRIHAMEDSDGTSDEESSSEEGEGPSTSKESNLDQTEKKDKKKKSSKYMWDAGYFESYSGFGIHYEMLRDVSRTENYRLGMEDSGVCQGARVLDVGCGTGVLSMFAVRGGAKSVVGVDASEIAPKARAIIEQNGMSDKISVQQSRLEKLEIDGQFDVIVSEWMGYFLVYESMLDTVINARDRFLAPGGTVQPRFFRMRMAACSLPQHLGFWDDVYGLQMDVMKHSVISAAHSGGMVEELFPENLLF